MRLRAVRGELKVGLRGGMLSVLSVGFALLLACACSPSARHAGANGHGSARVYRLWDFTLRVKTAGGFSFVVDEALLVEASAGRQDADPLTAPVVGRRCSRLVHGDYLLPIDHFVMAGTQSGFTEAAMRGRDPCAAAFGRNSRLLTLDELKLLFESDPWRFEYHLQPTYATEGSQLVRVSLHMPGCRYVMPPLDSTSAAVDGGKSPSSPCGATPTELRFHDGGGGRVLCTKPASPPELSLVEVERCLKAFSTQRYPDGDVQLRHLPASLGKLAFQVYSACKGGERDQSWSEVVEAASREIGEPAIREQFERLEHSPLDYALRDGRETARKNGDATAVASLEDKLNTWSREHHRLWFLTQIVGRLAACAKGAGARDGVLTAISEL